MEHIVVMNPFARRLRTEKGLLAKLRRIVGRSPAYIIDAASPEAMLEMLERTQETHQLSSTMIIIVGGDGTYKQVYTWTCKLPESDRPCLLPIGGGQFNFMARHVGWKSADPALNLSHLYTDRVHISVIPWRGIQLHDSISDQMVYGAVIGNGVLCDGVQAYNDSGKGDLFSVMKMVIDLVTNFFANTFQGTEGNAKMVNPGLVYIDGKELLCNEHAAFMASVVAEFMPTCRPFHQNITSQQFMMMVYHGRLHHLVMSIPDLWFGRKSFYTKRHTFNGLGRLVRVEVKDPRLIVDGELIILHTPTGIDPMRTLTLSYGPTIRLAHIVY